MDDLAILRLTVHKGLSFEAAPRPAGILAVVGMGVVEAVANASPRCRLPSKGMPWR